MAADSETPELPQQVQALMCFPVHVDYVNIKTEFWVDNYTQVQTLDTTSTDCWSVVIGMNGSFSFLLSNIGSFVSEIFRSKKLSLNHEFRTSLWRKYSARLFSSWRRATKAMSSANFTGVSKASVDTTSLVYTVNNMGETVYLTRVGNCLLVTGGELSTWHGLGTVYLSSVVWKSSDPKDKFRFYALWIIKFFCIVLYMAVCGRSKFPGGCVDLD